MAQISKKDKEKVLELIHSGEIDTITGAVYTNNVNLSVAT